MLLGALLLLVAGLALAYPVWWNHRLKTEGSKLVHIYKTTPVQPGKKCVTPPPPTSKSTVPAGLVTIPSLDMTAPVLQGLTDSVLNVAAGHDVGSPWPGGTGESILESHDVSYFSQISAMKVGQSVIWLDHCEQSMFKVVGHEVVNPGKILYPPSDGRGLALITCYPTDALFFTPDRYVLLTEWVGSKKAQATPAPIHIVLPRLRVPAPPDLVALGLNLDQNAILLGTMNLSGRPAPGWRQGPASLDLEALALASYFGAEKAIAAGNLTWWHDLAEKGLAMPPQWGSATIYVNEDLNGTHVVGITLSSTAVSFVLVPVHGDLLIKSVTVR